MKARRRHELQENVLSAELSQVVDFFKKRGTAIAWGVLIAALIVFVAVYVRGRSRQKHARLQAQFNTAMTDLALPPEDRIRLLEELAGQDDRQDIAALATVSLGDEYTRKSMTTMAGPLADPAEWKSFADRAAAYYRRAISSFADQKPAVARAHLGLGKLAESRGDLEAAREEYQAVLKIAGLAGHPAAQQAARNMQQLSVLAEPVRMASTAPAEPTTKPATEPVR